MMQKAQTIRSVNDFYAILDAVSKNIETNMQAETMLDFYNVAKDILINSNIDNINIEKTYLTGSDSHVFMPSLNSNVYVFEYNRESLAEIVHAMKVDLELEKPNIIKTFDFSANQVYETPVIGKKHLTN